MSTGATAIHPGTTPFIRLVSVSKVFRTDEVETHALSEVDLEIRRGEYVSVQGPSGCGKSTLLSLLGVLDTPTRGAYHFDEQPVGHLSATERARFRREHIGFIFQSFNLIGDLTARENVELPLRYQGVGGHERRRRADEVLERVGLSHRRNHFPHQLSGGQQQRVAVARAVAGRPEILLADEPTGNLDSENGAGIMRLLDELHRAGTTLCVVTHDPSQTRGAERRLTLLDGRIVAR